MRLLDETPIYYVYEHYKPNCDEPFGVGKGKDKRAYVKSKRNPRWMNIINKYGFEVRFVAEKLNEMDALWLENMCIKGWGRDDLGEGPLVNMTDGGEGGNGQIRSVKWRKQHSNRMKGASNPMYNKHLKKSSKRLMNIHKIGDIWITNINTDKMSRIKYYEQVPDGWRLGQSTLKRNASSRKASKYNWIALSSDGIIVLFDTAMELSNFLKIKNKKMRTAEARGISINGYTFKKELKSLSKHEDVIT